ncbi:hypothetical protein E2C01_091321 [Portunus trituberculatus]|uniref:Uncharacterized protein n=1 Tax=Portunus trituberculatus TaxID=210409 RepID=A0A5B7JNQ8_PORTR|nr:hypothetical protein [Portunus trituberculatus]
MLKFPCLSHTLRRSTQVQHQHTNTATHSSFQCFRLLSHGMRPIHATLDTHMLPTPLIIRFVWVDIPEQRTRGYKDLSRYWPS